MDIIAEVFSFFYESVTDILSAGITEDGNATLDDLIQRILEVCKTAAKKIIENFVEQVSQQFYESQERKDSDVKVKDRSRKKTVLSELGELELQNDTYTVPTEDGEGRHTMHPIMELFGITPHQRLLKSVGDALVLGALDKSYAKSAADVGAGHLTKQTVYNYVRNWGEVSLFTVPETQRQAKQLELFVDEDHIALQRDPKKKKSTIMPLGVLCEGKYKEGKKGDGRTRLLHPTYFVARDLNAKNMCAEIVSYIETCYDLDYVEEITVHGDGAGWIRKALDDLTHANVRSALDGFHLERALRKFAGHFPEQKKELLKTMKKHLRKNEKDLFFAVIEDRKEGTKDEKLLKKCDTFSTYLNTNWEASVIRMDKQTTGSCTEAQVQHVLSCRMSTIAKGWSRKNAGTIGALRAARMNKVDILHPKPEERQSYPYTHLVEQAVERVQYEKFDFSIFEHEYHPFNLDSGTQRLIAKLARPRGLAS